MKSALLGLFLASSLFFLGSCQRASKVVAEQAVALPELYSETHRPQFHFSPAKGWMNDPNGMVYYEGEYHLFYQFYPDSTVWGPMHWGHAISEDLVTWKHLPIALYPDENGLIFSGSAVVDWKNTSGFGQNGKPPLLAIYTYHDMAVERAGKRNDYQTQGIAFSNDKGRTWQKYEGNPVLGNPGIRDFRDPKVIWHQASEKWIMALSVLDHLNFYSSDNLKDWDFLSEFGRNIGSHGGVWECPDLFPMIADDGREYWVLIENMNPGNPNGGSGTQYFIGHFDGREFIVDSDFMQLLESVPEFVPRGRVFEDFENGYGRWTKEGDAFGDEPAPGSLEGQNPVKGFQGSKLLNSFYGGDIAKGRLLSKPFTIESKSINFLVGGGNHRGLTYIGLLVEDQLVRQTEGRNREVLEWNAWNVEAYIGSRAQIIIVDNYEGPWGHINIDQITFADEQATAAKSGSVWLDAGTDNYAGVTWSDVPASDGRRIFMGWMSNWAYAQVVPTDPWRSAMTLPWSLTLEQIDGIPRLIGKPVKELDKLAAGDWETMDLSGGVGNLPSSGLYELRINTDNVSSAPFGFQLSNSIGQKISLTLEEGILTLDRTQSSDNSFSKDFPGIHTAERISNDGSLKIHAFVDHSSIEIFIDDGKNIFSELFFPDEVYSQFSLLGNASETRVEVRPLKVIWE